MTATNSPTGNPTGNPTGTSVGSPASGAASGGENSGASTALRSPVAGGAGRAFAEWWFAPVAGSRVAFFRWAVYLFIPLDILILHPISSDHAAATAFYHPLAVARLLHLPHPSGPLIMAIKWSLIGLSLVAATGRLPRVVGSAIFLLYFEWTVIAFSFGKVDHDRIAFLVALAVLPTVGVARWRDHRPSQAAGWAIRCVQVAVVATYFLSAWAKIRFGGIEWVDSATLVRAMLRRGTMFADPLLQHPWTLHWAQYATMGFELASPMLLLLRSWWRYAMVGFLLSFHLMVFATVTIMFWPHVLCLLCAFLPTERILGSRAGVAGQDGV